MALPEADRPGIQLQRLSGLPERRIDPYTTGVPGTNTLDRIKSLADLGSAYLIARAAQKRERWSRPRMEAYQQARLKLVVDHARNHSPLYRELYGGLAAQSPLANHPRLTKQHVRERLADMLTVRSIDVEEVQDHADNLRGDDYFRGRYKVLTTSGTTGPKAFHIFNRHEWAVVLSGLVRRRWLAGLDVGLLSRHKVAVINRPDARTTSRRLGLATSSGRGLRRTEFFSAGDSLSKMAENLNRFRPDIVSGLPVTLSNLAREQIEGRLSINPSSVTPSSDAMSVDMRKRIGDAWGADIFDSYGLSETGVVAAECGRHEGMHLFEDSVILEAVDDDYRPVPVGVTASRVLLTSLHNFTQPLIRLEVDDLVTFRESPCNCGRSLRVIKSVEGRSDELLRLPTTDGGWLDVGPARIAGFAKSVPEVVEYEVASATPLRVRMVFRTGADLDVLVPQVRTGLLAMLVGSGVIPDLDLEIEAVDRIDRNPRSGKRQLTVSPRDDEPSC